ncbi:MAG: hypothetical protein QM762_25725 [Chryseolinea sp.]
MIFARTALSSTLIAITFLLSMMVATAFAQDKGVKTILFICEHGSAKSIVAAAYFNRIAGDKQLDIMAISRGTHPDAVVPDKINKLLNGDGFPNHSEKPTQLTKEDLKAADYVVSFTTIPTSYGNNEKIELWNAPSFESGYPASRDSIVHNIERIIERIKSQNQK